ncbi:MAG: hypothetical protein ABW193_02120 [Luteibacter sp.]
MRRNHLLPWLACCGLCAGDAAALQIDETDLSGVVLLRVEATDDPVTVGRRLADLVDNGRRTVITGSPEDVARMRPDFALVWPTTDTVVMDPAIGLGIYGFDAADDDVRKATLSDWPWNEDPLGHAPSRAARAVSDRPGKTHVDLRVSAASPSMVCLGFYRQLSGIAFAGAVPTADERRAFRREAHRWCQYGNLSTHAAEPAQFAIEPFRYSDLPLLSLVAEWALIRAEDSTDSARTTYMFWTKTLGEGAGTGFTRADGGNAYLDGDRNEVRYLMDAAIHSGWGSIEPRQVVTAWPMNSTFPRMGNVHVFRCDAPEAFRPDDCAVSPRLRKLYPDDSRDGVVNISTGETLTFGGDIKVSRSIDSEGKQAISFSFGLNLSRAETDTATTDMPLANTRSSADTVSYRSTWWHPDVSALFRWIQARQPQGTLAPATALAATLNPRHEILWELPLASNADRALPYHVVYEAGLNTCWQGWDCTTYRWPPEPEARSKARVGWSDGVVVRLPAN